ncbi:MAG: hypothetical protein ACYTHM_14550 [Planctomycetota bacterium]|jgi:hypothetical protein
MKSALLIGAGILVAAAVLFVVVQGDDLFAQDGPGPGGRGPGGRGGFPGMQRRGGGGVAMTTIGKHLYIVSGTTLFKVDPHEMKIVKTLELRAEGDDRPERGDQRGPGRKGW